MPGKKRQMLERDAFFPFEKQGKQPASLLQYKVSPGCEMKGAWHFHAELRYTQDNNKVSDGWAISVHENNCDRKKDCSIPNPVGDQFSFPGHCAVDLKIINFNINDNKRISEGGCSLTWLKQNISIDPVLFKKEVTGDIFPTTENKLPCLGFG